MMSYNACNEMLFPYNLSFKFKTRHNERYKLNHANTERYKKSSLIFPIKHLKTIDIRHFSCLESLDLTAELGQLQICFVSKSILFLI